MYPAVTKPIHGIELTPSSALYELTKFFAVSHTVVHHIDPNPFSMLSQHCSYNELKPLNLSWKHRKQEKNFRRIFTVLYSTVQ